MKNVVVTVEIEGHKVTFQLQAETFVMTQRVQGEAGNQVSTLSLKGVLEGAQVQ